MLIDWFTVIAQALNFLILVWLLKRFAYQPVLQAINQREQRIAAQVAAAAAAQAAATTERDTLSRKSDELEQQRAALLEQVTQEAKATRSRLLEQAREDADAQRVRLLAALSAEQADLRSELGSKVREAVLQIAASAMRDLAHVALNEAMVNVFLEHLGELGEADRHVLGMVGTNSATALVRSAFELAPPTRVRIQAAVAALGWPGARVQFETSTDLVCGIELQAAGHKLAWSVGDYLEGLQNGIDHILETHGGAAPATSEPVPAAAS
jgi:F-type H+-transporting ATPase subunit b